MLCLDDAPSRAREPRLRPVTLAPPGPAIAEPKSRKEDEVCALGPAVKDGDADQEVVGRRLGVLGHDVEVAVLVEDTGIRELELAGGLSAAALLLAAPAIGGLSL